jgi:hypothetical protein
MCSLDRAGGREFTGSPSLPGQDWDVTGNSAVNEAVTDPVMRGGLCKGCTWIRRDRAVEPCGVRA